MSITVFLALFTLLLISAATFFAAKRSHIPYTVLLVLVGMVIGPIVELPSLEPSLGFLNDLSLTPELLFYVFLPMLIFESAFNINIRRMVENAWHIGLLSIIGLFISAGIIALVLWLALSAMGIVIPFVILLLFGAIISATDPVAVLALFKEYGAPKRLSLIFEGESLFNDGTAVALFVVVLGVVTYGYEGTATILDGLVVFGEMLLFGVVFGIIAATIFSRALRYTRSNEFVSITMLLVSAHMVFIISEFINEHGLFGLDIHVSAIIATTVAALFLGNYARHILSPASDAYLHKSIEHLAFTANSLVFLLAGILFSSIDIALATLWLPIAVTVVIVAGARALSVYAITLPLNRLKPTLALPASWQFLLAWGSLRGALAIIVVLLIPDTLVVDGWGQAYSVKEFLLALTIGCILATLFVKATTIGWFMQRLGLTTPTPLRQARMIELGLDYLATQKIRITQQKHRGHLPESELAELENRVVNQMEQTEEQRKKLLARYGHGLFFRALHYTALCVEQRYLKELYSNQEINESVYRKILGKLTLQQEKIEYAQHESINPSAYMDQKDVFDRLVLFATAAMRRTNASDALIDQYQYYRAQSIIAKKVLKTLLEAQQPHATPIFDPDSHKKVVAIYEKYHDTALQKEALIKERHSEVIAPFLHTLASRTLRANGKKSLRYFRNRGLADEELAASIDALYTS